MDAIGAPGASGGSTAATGGPSAHGFGSFDDFLRLLTTQLRQQDPLEPMDAESFTRQLVQYSTVEQAVKANARIETLIETVRAGQILQAAGFVGRTVHLSGSRLWLPAEGAVQLSYVLPEPAASVRAIVRDSEGHTVAELDGLPTSRGPQTAAWDGRDRLGRRLGEGLYEVELEALAPDGRRLEPEVGTSGRVQAVRFDGERLLLLVGGRPYPASDVIAVGDVEP